MSSISSQRHETQFLILSRKASLILNASTLNELLLRLQLYSNDLVQNTIFLNMNILYV